MCILELKPCYLGHRWAVESVRWFGGLGVLSVVNLEKMKGLSFLRDKANGL